jgi:hypothetical protein
MNHAASESDGPLSEQVNQFRKLRAAGKSEIEVQATLGVPDLAGEEKPRPRRNPRQEPPQPEEPALAFISLKDLFNTPEVKIDWLVDGLLPIGGLSLLVAKPKAGKSTLARNLALAVAQGRDFLGKPTQQGLVIYLALEEKLSEVKRHFFDMGATGDEPILTLAARLPASAFQQVRIVAERQHPVLIIVDPLFYLTHIRDGNDYAEVSRALAPFLALARETGAHILCVHHAGKIDREGGDSIIGSTALFAAVDTAILLKRTERYRTIRSIQRYGVDLPETVMSFDPQTRTLSLGATREQEEEDRLADTILEFLDSKEVPTLEVDIDQEVEGRRGTRKRALRLLVTQGKVERTGKGEKGSPYLYAVNKAGSQS